MINGPSECPVPGQPPRAAALAASHALREALWCWLRPTTPGGGVAAFAMCLQGLPFSMCLSRLPFLLLNDVGGRQPGCGVSRDIWSRCS